VIPRPRIKRRCSFDFSQKLRQVNGLQAGRQAGCDANFGQRAIDQITHRHQATIKNGSGRSPIPLVPALIALAA